MDYDGAFLSICSSQQIHLLKLLDVNERAQERGIKYRGRDNHIAINVSSIGRLKQKLDSHNVPCQLSSSGRLALFCRDPDGNALEFLQKTY